MWYVWSRSPISYFYRKIQQLEIQKRLLSLKEADIQQVQWWELKGNSRYESIHGTWPTITVTYRYSDSAIIDIWQDNHIMTHHNIRLTEEYKMHTLHT